VSLCLMGSSIFKDDDFLELGCRPSISSCSIGTCGLRIYIYIYIYIYMQSHFYKLIEYNLDRIFQLLRIVILEKKKRKRSIQDG
jgi:hypothetical protein